MMRNRPSMPIKNKIHSYWKEHLNLSIDNNTCYKCGYTHDKHNAVERAHIEPWCETKNNNVENIHLLCSVCHKDSEHFTGELYWLWFNSKHVLREHFTMQLCYLYRNNIFTSFDDDLKAVFDKIIEDFTDTYGAHNVDKWLGRWA